MIWKLYLGIIFLITLIIFYPLIFPFLFSENGKKKSFKLFVAWSSTVKFFGGFITKKITNSKLPEGPYIIVANHSSYLDILMMPAIMHQHRFLFLGKSEILGYPLIKTFFKRLNIPVFRDNPIKAGKSLIRARQEIKNGWSLVIFAEGAIPDSDRPKMIPFKDGAFRLAKKAKVPIIPLTFTTNYKRLSDPDNILGPAGPGHCKMHIHPYISVDEISKLSEDELTKKCFDIINGPILKEYPQFRS